MISSVENMNENEDAAPDKPEGRDVTIPGVTAKAVARANVPKVIAELDRIAVGIRWTKRGIIATIILSSVAIALSLINLALQLQYLKVI